MATVFRLPTGEQLLIIGVIVLFIGIALIVSGGLISSLKSEKTNIRSAGIIFIGPFPIGWASDKRMFYILIGLVTLVFLLWIIFSRFGR